MVAGNLALFDYQRRGRCHNTQSPSETLVFSHICDMHIWIALTYVAEPSGPRTASSALGAPEAADAG